MQKLVIHGKHMDILLVFKDNLTKTEKNGVVKKINNSIKRCITDKNNNDYNLVSNILNRIGTECSCFWTTPYINKKDVFADLTVRR